jgi:hypothetical protein
MQNGEPRNGRYRVNKLNGDVEFIIMRRSSSKHLFNSWHRMGDGWIISFVPFERGVKND